MDLSLPMHDSVVTAAVSEVSLVFAANMGIGVLYSLSRPKERRRKTVLVCLLISLLVSIPFLNIQTALMITDEQVVIEHLIWGPQVIALSSITEVAEGRYKSNVTFALVMDSGEGIRLEARGQKARAIGDAVSERAGLVYVPVDGRMRWIR